MPIAKLPRPAVMLTARFFAGLTLAALAACGPAPMTDGIVDPMEAQNREMHAVNKEVDHAVIKPLAELLGKAQPGPIRRGVSNFASNLAVPNDIVNDILQVNIGEAAHNTFRFALNSTIGLGGLIDVASAMDLPAKPTDFGETLHVWGMGEGNYIELPLVGPSTERDTLGRAGDIVLDPIWYFLPLGQAAVAYGLVVLDDLNWRDRYSATVDSVLYDSADSYAQERLLYLQNRRYELGQTSGTGGADAGGDTSAGGFIDPYEDSNGN